MRTQRNLAWMTARWLAMASLGILGSTSAWGQPVVYLRTNVAGVKLLHVINSDGTGDRAIPVALPEVAAVSFSKDGRFLALTSQTPGRPAQRSKNVFLLDMQRTQLSQITSYEDTLYTNGGFSFKVPWFHAVQANNEYLAVWTFTQTAGVLGRYPTLDYYSISNRLWLSSLHSEPPLDGAHAGGYGVDFHPSQSMLVAALYAVIPMDDGAGHYLEPGEGTALDLCATNGWRQLTYPVGHEVGTKWEFENDFAPAFSPNGDQVAFVRAVNATVNWLQQYWTPSLHIVNTDGSGEHAVIAFPQGNYITHVSWSRDGTQLVFDMGQQLVLNSLLQLDVDPSTAALYVVNTDGTGLRMLRPPMGTSAVWSPAGTTFCNLPGVTAGGAPGTGTIDDCGQPIYLNLVRTPDGLCRLDIRGGMSNLLYQVKASPDLKTWQSLGTVPYSGPTSSFIDPTSGTLPRRFYRVGFGNN